MKLNSKSGATLAAAAATMFLAGAAMAPSASAQDKAGQCVGANACKGQSACKSGKSACKGQNACKGQGFVEMTQADCTKAGGKYQKS